VSKLTDKQKIFVSNYLKNGFNATQAAISAGYSKKTARSQGQRLLTNVDIELQINKHQEKKQKQHGIEVDYIIEELQLVINQNKDLHAKLKALKQLTELLGLDATFKLKEKLSNSEHLNKNEQPNIVINV